MNIKDALNEVQIKYLSAKLCCCILVLQLGYHHQKWNFEMVFVHFGVKYFLKEQFLLHCYYRFRFPHYLYFHCHRYFRCRYFVVRFRSERPSLRHSMLRGAKWSKPAKVSSPRKIRRERPTTPDENGSHDSNEDAGAETPP